MGYYVGDEGLKHGNLAIAQFFGEVYSLEESSFPLLVKSTLISGSMHLNSKPDKKKKVSQQLQMQPKCLNSSQAKWCQVVTIQ